MHPTGWTSLLYLAVPSTSAEYSGAPGAIFTPPQHTHTQSQSSQNCARGVAADYMPGPKLQALVRQREVKTNIGIKNGE